MGPEVSSRSDAIPPMSKKPANEPVPHLRRGPPLAPGRILDFAHQAASCLPRRKQRVLAVYYVGLLATSAERQLSKAVPANVYRPLRHFLADVDWDGREVLWRAVAEVLGDFAIEWLGLGVTAIRERYSVAHLSAYDATACLPLDLVLVGPARLVREPADYIPAQLELLQTVPDVLLRRAPLAIADAIAEDASIRAALAARGITYSATLGLPGRASAGRILAGGRHGTLAAFAAALRRAGDVRPGPQGVTWTWREITLASPGTAARQETAVVYWHHGELAAVAVTNERDPTRLLATYDPQRPDWLARPRPKVPWRATGLRSARAWEHHLALVAVLEAARIHFRG